MNKSVVVVEDDRTLRQQIVDILGSASDIRCIGAFASAEEALKAIPSKAPDVVLMDIKLPGMSGIDCVAKLKRMLPSLQIIMVTIFEDSERIFRALKAGASGYLVKSRPPEQLLEAIRDVLRPGATLVVATSIDTTQSRQSYGLFNGRPELVSWWVMSPEGLIRMCAMAGFTDISWVDSFVVGSRHGFTDTIGVARMTR